MELHCIVVKPLLTHTLYNLSHRLERHLENCRCGGGQRMGPRKCRLRVNTYIKIVSLYALLCSTHMYWFSCVHARTHIWVHAHTHALVALNVCLHLFTEVWDGDGGCWFWWTEPLPSKEQLALTHERYFDSNLLFWIHVCMQKLKSYVDPLKLVCGCMAM